MSATILNQICLYLAKYPETCLFTARAEEHDRYSSRFVRKGWPHITGQWGGRPLYIAVKSPEDAIALGQWRIIEQARQMGAIAFTATSVDDVIKELNSFVGGNVPPAA
jgi:hypothetical protein